MKVSNGHPKNLALAFFKKRLLSLSYRYLYQQTGKHVANILICLIYSGTNRRNIKAQSYPVK